MNKPQKKKPLNKYLQLTGIAFQMGAIIGFGTFIGVKFDAYFQNKNSIFTIFGSLVSVLASIYLAIKQITDFSKRK